MNMQNLFIGLSADQINKIISTDWTHTHIYYFCPENQAYLYSGTPIKTGVKLDLNPCKIPAGVEPETWLKELTYIVKNVYGLSDAAERLFFNVLYELYEENGVFAARNSSELEILWVETVSIVSGKVTLRTVCDMVEKQMKKLADPCIPKSMHENVSEYKELLAAFSLFRYSNTTESTRLATPDGLSIDQIAVRAAKKGSVVIIDLNGLCAPSRAFLTNVLHHSLKLWSGQFEREIMEKDIMTVCIGTDKGLLTDILTVPAERIEKKEDRTKKRPTSEKMARELCKDILMHDVDAIVIENTPERTWDSITTRELIEKAGIAFSSIIQRYEILLDEIARRLEKSIGEKPEEKRQQTTSETKKPEPDINANKPDIIANADVLTDSAKKLIEKIGTKGFSDFRAIADSIPTEGNKSAEHKLMSQLNVLVLTGFLKNEKVMNLPLENKNLYELTQVGRDFYRKTYGRAVRPSDMSRLNNMFGSYRYGYTVKEIVKALKKPGESTLKDERYAVKKKGRIVLTPDIVYKGRNDDDSTYTMRFLVEDGSRNETEVMSRITMAAEGWAEVNLICADDNTMASVSKYLDLWLEENQTIAYGVTFRITTLPVFKLGGIENGWVTTYRI